MIDLSVCIVSRNTKKLLEACLRSVYEETGEISFEIFVVDNASGDGSAAMIKEKFPGVVLLVNKENKGFAAANNQAIHLAKGRYVILLNPDTFIHQGALDKMVRFMDHHPEAGAAGCRLLNEDGTIQNSVRRFLTFRMALYENTLLGKTPFFKKGAEDYKMEGFSFNSLEEVDVAGGAALMLRKTVLDEVGLLDEGYFMFIEEMDLCRRIWDRQHKVFFIPDAVITHLGGRSRRQNSELVLVMQKSLMRYFAKFEGAGKTRVFKIFYKPLFIMGIVHHLLFDSLHFIKYKTVRKNLLKSEKRKAEIKGAFRFLVRDLGYFLAKL